MKHARTTIVSITLVVCLFLQPIAFDSGKTNTAEALWATEFTQLKNTLENTINTVFANINTNANLSSLGIQWSLLNKEFTFDGLAFFIAKAALQSITGSLINWINSGFKGNPAFVQNLEQHLMSVADQELARLVFSPEALSFLCDPFKLDVRAAVAVTFQKQMSDRADYQGPQCGFSKLEDNFENFLAGDFIGGGGMDTFFTMTQNPAENTALGALLEVETQVNARIVNAENQEINLLNFGDGFLSFKICEKDKNGIDTNKCTIQTPGQTISEALTFQLSTGPRSLIEADEINEIIGALFYALMNQAIQGVGGLLGLSGEGSGDYLDKIRSGQAYSYEDVQQTSADEVFTPVNISRNSLNVTVDPAPEPATVPTVQIDQATIDAIIAGINSAGGGAGTPPDQPVEPPVTDPAPDTNPDGLPPSVDKPD